MDNSQRERENSKASQEKLTKDLFKVGFFILVLKGIKIITDRL
jgi:hypothetical protein